MEKLGKQDLGASVQKTVLKYQKKLYPTEHKDQIYPGYIYQGLV